jgi:3-phenylpropionate/trans-cinnamate dioxygenase ferredoxin reductase subunit
MDHIAVIGAGQAGASAAETLRKAGFEGRLTLWGDEPEPPYQRPPLSKGYLLGEIARERLWLRPPSFWEDQGVELRLGARIDALDPVARSLRHAGGEERWDAAILATGSAANRLPERIVQGRAGVHVIRGLADIDALSPEMVAGRRMLVVGGGYIGLEAAAVARKIGLEVVLVEMGARLLGRVASAETADWFRDLHRSHGVDIREGAGLEALVGEGCVTGARLTDGSEIDVDLVLAGIGAHAVTDLAEAAGLACSGGIVVDDRGRSSCEGVWAAGDCAAFPQNGARIRLESVPHAIEHAEAVARNVLGADAAYVAKPWFWSDQYDVKLQIAGLNSEFDRIVTRDDAGRSHWYFKGDRLLAVDAMNDPRAYMVGKRLIEAGRSPDPVAVADPSVPVKALMA